MYGEMDMGCETTRSASQHERGTSLLYWLHKRRVIALRNELLTPFPEGHARVLR